MPERRRPQILDVEPPSSFDPSGSVEHFPDATFLPRQGGAILYLHEKARRPLLAGHAVLQTADGKLTLAEQGLL